MIHFTVKYLKVGTFQVWSTEGAPKGFCVATFWTRVLLPPPPPHFLPYTVSFHFPFSRNRNVARTTICGANFSWRTPAFQLNTRWFYSFELIFIFLFLFLKVSFLSPSPSPTPVTIFLIIMGFNFSFLFFPSNASVGFGFFFFAW